MRYCKKLTNYSDIANDLYQEFFMFMFSKPEEELINIYKSGGLEQYCLCIIFNKSRQVDVFFKSQGQDNPLLRISNNAGFNPNEYDKAEHINYNHEVDLNFDKVMDYVSSDESIKQEDWLIFSESIDTKLVDISKETGIPYITLKVRRKRIKDKIKQNVSI